MNAESIAINEVELDKYMLDVIDCSNKVKALFNKIDDAMENLKASYQCPSADELYKQYEEFNDNYQTIVSNLLSYNSDLMSLKKKYVGAMDNLTQEIIKDTAILEASSVPTYKEER